MHTVGLLLITVWTYTIYHVPCIHHPELQHWFKMSNVSTTLAVSVGKVCSPRILPLPTPVQCWLNTFRVTEDWSLLFSNIERGNGVQEVVFEGFWSWFDVFRHFPTQFVQGCSFTFLFRQSFPVVGSSLQYSISHCFLARFLTKRATPAGKRGLKIGFPRYILWHGWHW